LARYIQEIDDDTVLEARGRLELNVWTKEDSDTGYMYWWAERNMSEDMDETGTDGNTHTPKPFELRDEAWVWPTPQWHLQKPVLREPKGTRKCASRSNNNAVGAQMNTIGLPQ